MIHAATTVIRLGLCLLVLSSAIARAANAESASSASPSRGILQRWVPALATARRAAAAALADGVRELGATRRPSALARVALLALVSGVLAAAGPGQGKLAIAAYFVARRTGVRRALATSGVVALLQVGTSLTAAAIFAGWLGRDRLGVLRGTAEIELVSYVLVAVVGLCLLFRAASGRDGLSWVDAVFAVAAGLTPSAAALGLVLFARSNGLLGAGLAAALFLAIGIAVTLSIVALLSLAVRAGFLRATAVGERARRQVDRALALAGALTMAVAGLAFSWDAWTALR